MISAHNRVSSMRMPGVNPCWSNDGHPNHCDEIQLSMILTKTLKTIYYSAIGGQFYSSSNFPSLRMTQVNGVYVLSALFLYQL